MAWRTREEEQLTAAGRDGVSAGGSGGTSARRAAAHRGVGINSEAWDATRSSDDSTAR